MTGDTFFNNNLLFNLTQFTANRKSTISHMYQRVLPIYSDEIGPDTFNYKSKNNHKSFFKYSTENLYSVMI